MKRYPCTGHVDLRGFPAYLEGELGASRHNLQAFARELEGRFDAARIVLTNSGSSANLAAAFALREVTDTHRRRAIISGFTFPTTVAALVTAGFEPYVVDTEPGGFGIDPSAAERAMDVDTSVICVTHFLGFSAAVDRLVEVAAPYQAQILQDGCETMDAFVGDRRAHQISGLTTWSFYHPHHLSAYGGGAVIASNERLQRKLESITHWGRACTCHVPDLPCVAPHGRDHNFWYERPGFNLEMSELNACFGRFQLARFDRDEAVRKQHYGILHEALADLDGVRVWAPPKNTGSPFVFPIALDDPLRVERVCQWLDARGVETRSLMGGAITRQPAYALLRNDGLKECQALSERAFCVGVHQTLPEVDVMAVGRLLREALGC